MKPQTSRRIRSGFTLIELLGAIALIAVLIALWLPEYRQVGVLEPNDENTRSRAGVLLSDAGPALAPTCVVADLPEGTLTEFVFKTTPEKELKAYVHFPPDWKASDRRPGIVFWHGGAWMAGTSAQFAPQAEHLAGLGMVAIRADYRLRVNNNGVTLDKCVEDAKSALRWVRKSSALLGIDPGRIVGAGGSAGGHLAACVATLDEFDAKGDDLSVSCRPSALVLFNPVPNVVTASADLPDLFQRLAMEAGLAKRVSPTFYVSKDTPPALLLYGTEDKFFPQGQEFVAAMKKAGSRAEMFTAEGAGHGFFNSSPWQERTLKPMDDFLASLGYLPVKGIK